MPINFFDIEDIVYHEIVPHGQTVNWVFFEDLSICLRKGFAKNDQKNSKEELGLFITTMFQLLIRKFLPYMFIAPHPPYFLDMVSRDYFSFSENKVCT